MKILLVRPPYTRIRGVGQTSFFPLGIGHLAAVLRQEGHETYIYYAENPGPGDEVPVHHKQKVFESRHEAHQQYVKSIENDELPVWQEFRNIVQEIKPDVTGISLLSVEVASSLKLTKIAKREHPETFVVWGGSHPTFMPEDCLGFDEVDAVIRGEGENTIKDLVQALESGADIQKVRGLSFKLNKSFIHNNIGPLIESLDSIPFPARDAVLFPERFPTPSMGVIMTSRGCPWRCGFCSSRIFWQKIVRFRSAENVMKEIKEVHEKYGTRYFTFWDDAFTMERDKAVRICEQIEKLRLPIFWRTATRLDLIDPPLLKLMKKAGCVQLEVGIESGSPRILDLICKDIQLSKVRSAIDMVNDHGMACGVFFMAGFPDETEEDLRLTLNTMEKLNTSEIVLNVFDPMPGSDQYERLKELDLIKEPVDWLNFALWPDAHYVKNITPERFNELIEMISVYVFKYNRSFPAIKRRAIPEIKALLKKDPKLLLNKAWRFLTKR